jgi:predicted RNase H-like HicB family nuclease
MRKTAKMLHYPVVFEPAQEGGYNVSFPSLPGCVTFGKTFEEAKEKAREVLVLWLEELAEHGEEIPTHAERPVIDEILVPAPSKARLAA